MNHQFHYSSGKQAQQWLELHEAYSPARTDEDCLQTYDRALAETAEMITAKEIALISFGCGGGQKDLTLLKSLSATKLHYVPTDVSVPLAVTAHLRAAAELTVDSRPAVVDLANADNLPEFVDSLVPGSAKRVIAFFGMLPNFEAGEALKLLAAALRPGDELLISANLAPGNDYQAGVEKVLPLYDNVLTRRWLVTSLLDAGLDASPNDIEFRIQPFEDLLRIEAKYCFRSAQRIRIDAEDFKYEPGEKFRLFFSYRHTPALARRILAQYGIEVRQEWVTASSEEGIFLCRKSG